MGDEGYTYGRPWVAELHLRAPSGDEGYTYVPKTHYSNIGNEASGTTEAAKG